MKRSQMNDWLPFVSVWAGLGAVLAVLVFVAVMLLQVYGIEERIRAKDQAILCIMSVTPTERTTAYVKECYDKADAANGVQITRYGDALNERE